MRGDGSARPVALRNRPRPSIRPAILLADLNLAGGARRHGSTAVLQATCVDATVIPHLEDRLNFSLGCYGCRDATDLAPAETVLGFPGRMLEALTDQVGFLNEKAIPRSRGKNAWKQFQRNEEERGLSTG
jgi:uncharacterized protein (DUF169 family)